MRGCESTGVLQDTNTANSRSVVCGRSPELSVAEILGGNFTGVVLHLSGIFPVQSFISINYSISLNSGGDQDMDGLEK